MTVGAPRTGQEVGAGGRETHTQPTTTGAQRQTLRRNPTGSTGGGGAGRLKNIPGTFGLSSASSDHGGTARQSVPAGAVRRSKPCTGKAPSPETGTRLAISSRPHNTEGDALHARGFWVLENDPTSRCHHTEVLLSTGCAPTSQNVLPPEVAAGTASGAWRKKVIGSSDAQSSPPCGEDIILVSCILVDRERAHTWDRSKTLNHRCSCSA